MMIETAQPPDSCLSATSTSFLASRGVDWDLGRSVLQHRPLNRGASAQRTLVKVFDDPGMRPKVLHPHQSKRYGERDNVPLAVQGSAFAAGSHSSSALQATAQPQRMTNPMAPCYKLSSAPDAGNASLAAPPPRFVRDSISVDDIQGARPRVVQRATYGAALDISDIEGSSPARRSGERAGQICGRQHNPLQVHDINTAPFAAPSRATDVPPPASTAPSYVPPAPVWSEPEMFGQIGPATDRLIATAIGTGRCWAERQAVHTHAARSVMVAERSAAAAAGHAAFEEIAAAASAASAPLTAAAAGAFWDTCRAADRQGSGKVSAYEFQYALELAGVAGSASPQQLDALARGWKDHAGYIAYRDLSRKLLHSAQAAASSPAAAAVGRGDPCSSTVPQQASTSLPPSVSVTESCPPVQHSSSMRQHAGDVGPASSTAVAADAITGAGATSSHSAAAATTSTTSTSNAAAEYLVRMVERHHAVVSSAGANAGAGGGIPTARASSAQPLRAAAVAAAVAAAAAAAPMRRPASAVDLFRPPGAAGDDGLPRGGRISRAAVEAYRRATYHDAAGTVAGPAPWMRRPASAIDARKSTVQSDAAGSTPRDRPSSALRAAHDGTAMWFGGNEEGAPRSADRPWSAKGESSRFMPGEPFLRVGSGGRDTVAAAAAVAAASWPESVLLSRSASTPRQRPATATARFAGSGSVSSSSHGGSGRWGARPTSNTARMQRQIVGDDVASVRGLI